MASQYSAILLAAVGAPQGQSEVTAVTQLHRGKLKEALELGDAAIAVTSSGEFLGVYHDAGTALDAALSFQTAADELAASSPLAFTGRIVLDIWPTSSEQIPVNHARDILHRARAHCILVTPEFAHVMPANLRNNLAHYTAAGEPIGTARVSEFLWRDRAATFRVSTRMAPSAPKVSHYQAVSLSRRGTTVVITAEDCPFSLGRDAACALAIGGPSVSRLHGAVVNERGRFYFRDDSRNGTYLTTGGEEMFLHNERFPLVSQGVISPGITLVEQTGDIIRYQCLEQQPDTAS